MTLQFSGAISLADIQTEFGGSNPISLNEYYSGGAYVPASTLGYPGGVVTTIPSSSTISFANFHGSAKRSPQLYTFTANSTWAIPAGMTSARIIIVGGGGRGGNAKKTQYNGEYTLGGHGGGGQVIDITTNLEPNYAISISMGIGGGNFGNTSSRGGSTTVSIPQIDTFIAVGGYAGVTGLNIVSGAGGASGDGYAGGIPDPDPLVVDEAGGGGGGAGGPGVVDQGGPGITVNLGGVSITVGNGGPGTANYGAGGNGTARMVLGESIGGGGFNGVVYIYG
jgi:hypothetical protein